MNFKHQNTSSDSYDSYDVEKLMNNITISDESLITDLDSNKQNTIKKSKRHYDELSDLNFHVVTNKLADLYVDDNNDKYARKKRYTEIIRKKNNYIDQKICEDELASMYTKPKSIQILNVISSSSSSDFSNPINCIYKHIQENSALITSIMPSIDSSSVVFSKTIITEFAISDLSNLKSIDSKYESEPIITKPIITEPIINKPIINKPDLGTNIPTINRDIIKFIKTLSNTMDETEQTINNKLHNLKRKLNKLDQNLKYIHSNKYELFIPLKECSYIN
jgi:hypothetical protein